VANQAELVLAKFILESRTKQVLEHSCLALSKLAGFGAYLTSRPSASAFGSSPDQAGPVTLTSVIWGW
jgi:hypothetical protein